jgi:hypothetical protein
MIVSIMKRLSGHNFRNPPRFFSEIAEPEIQIAFLSPFFDQLIMQQQRTGGPVVAEL